MGFDAFSLRNDPRTTAISQYGDLIAQQQQLQQAQLLGGLFSGDPQAAAASLGALAQMNPVQLLGMLRMMDPQLFNQLAMGIIGAALQQAMMGGQQQPGACGGQNAGGQNPWQGGVPLADMIAQNMFNGRGNIPTSGRNAGNLRGNPNGGVPRAPSERNVPNDQLRGSTDGRFVPGARVYRPGSPEAVGLFREAARLAGVPESWASSQALHNILSRESGGVVGRPNYTYGGRANDRSQWDSIHNELKNGRITARSSATGLGQLLLSNVDRYYPAGRAGIGDPVQEAAGMLRYIKSRYGSPEVAWARYNTRHEGY